MWRHVLLLSALCALQQAAAAPAPPVDNNHALVTLSPQFISLARFEELLRRAGEIFSPEQSGAASTVPLGTEPISAAVAEPRQHMMPPNEQPYNFYLPLFDYVNENEKLDAKSRRLEKFAPPPEPTQQQAHNYYADKPKKSPKKFNAATKQLNINWLNALERELEPPKVAYLVNDERNRINFDNSFFGADMPVQVLNSNAQRATTSQAQGDGLRSAEEAEEDLVAAPATQQLQLA